MPRRIVSTDRFVGELLSPKRRFTTPSYQRPYSWTTEEIGCLYSDLRNHLIVATRMGRDADPYFLGPMVFFNDGASAEFAVVDGQQRLMSLTILLAVLRDLDREAASLCAGAVLERRRFGGSVEPLMRPRKRDAAFFYDNIQKAGAVQQLTDEITPENAAQARMLENALWLRHELSGVPTRELRWLAELILRGCQVIEADAPNEDLAHKVFQGMNDRGLDLRVNDVLKSDVIGALDVEDRAFAADAWEDLETELGADEFKQLFGHIRKLHRPQKAERAVLTELREILRPATQPKPFLEHELLPRGRAMVALNKAAMPLSAHAERVNRLVRGLNRLPNADWRTVAIGFFADRRPRGDEALMFMTALDRLGYAMALASADENTRIARYKKPIEALREGLSVAEICEIMELTPNERKVARDVLDGAFYNKERIRLPVLLRLDEHLSETGAWYDLVDISVEHILPRNPPEDSPWRATFPDAKQRKKLTDKIGNLTLLSRRKNSKAANLPFRRKTREYFASGVTTPFALTTRLITETDWTPETLNRRQKELVDAACRMWRL